MWAGNINPKDKYQNIDKWNNEFFPIISENISWSLSSKKTWIIFVIVSHGKKVHVKKGFYLCSRINEKRGHLFSFSK